MRVSILHITSAVSVFSFLLLFCCILWCYCILEGRLILVSSDHYHKIQQNCQTKKGILRLISCLRILKSWKKLSTLCDI